MPRRARPDLWPRQLRPPFNDAVPADTSTAFRDADNPCTIWMYISCWRWAVAQLHIGTVYAQSWAIKVPQDLAADSYWPQQTTKSRSRCLGGLVGGFQRVLRPPVLFNFQGEEWFQGKWRRLPRCVLVKASRAACLPWPWSPAPK
jgi:hypothetical protein